MKFDKVYKTFMLETTSPTHFVIVSDKIDSEWYNKKEAEDYVKEKQPNGKIVDKKGLKKLGLEPSETDDKLGGEALDKD